MLCGSGRSIMQSVQKAQVCNRVAWTIWQSHYLPWSSAFLWNAQRLWSLWLSVNELPSFFYGLQEVTRFKNRCSSTLNSRYSEPKATKPKHFPFPLSAMTHLGNPDDKRSENLLLADSKAHYHLLGPYPWDTIKHHKRNPLLIHAEYMSLPKPAIMSDIFTTVCS